MLNNMHDKHNSLAQEFHCEPGQELVLYRYQHNPTRVSFVGFQVRYVKQFDKWMPVMQLEVQLNKEDIVRVDG